VVVQLRTKEDRNTPVARMARPDRGKPSKTTGFGTFTKRQCAPQTAHGPGNERQTQEKQRHASHKENGPRAGLRVCGAGLRPSTAVNIRRSRPSRSRGSTRGSARRRASPRRARVSHQGSGGAGNPTRRRTPLRVPGAPPDSRGGRLPDRPRSVRRPAPLVSDLRPEAHSTG